MEHIDRGPLGEHAVVLGASMGGLFAARVLADRFRQVTVVERDSLPDEPTSRKGAPQARHPHALLARGAQTLDELFPAILDDLVADGAPVWDDGDLSRTHISFGGHLMPHSGMIDTDDLKTARMYQPSRPLLEHHVRQRVHALPNVTLLDNLAATQLIATADRRRVTGVQLADQAGGAGKTLTADLVVDAMGRGAHTPSFLETLGYGRPIEQHIHMRTTYVSQKLKMRPGALREMLVNISPEQGRPTGMFLVHNENNIWTFTVCGMTGLEPPHGLDSMLTFVERFAPPHMLDAVRAAEPLGPVVGHRMPSSRWRRYDKMRRFPDGLVVTGDAVCSFNPIYGQGMSIAAADALALRAELGAGLDGLPPRFFRTAAKSIAVAWQLGAGSDLAFPEVQGHRTPLTRLNNRFSDWLLSACESDRRVHAEFLRVAGLLDPPSRLFSPVLLGRMARANLFHRRHPSRTFSDSHTTAHPPVTSAR